MSSFVVDAEFSAARSSGQGRYEGEDLLFLTDERLQQGIELLFFAYRGFTAGPDRILEEYGLGRAHHRALHFIARCPEISVSELLVILRITKQSLNRVLRDLLRHGLVTKQPGGEDRRRRRLLLTERGQVLQAALADSQRARVRRAYRAAGVEAVSGFRAVLAGLISEDERDAALRLIAGGAGE